MSSSPKLLDEKAVADSLERLAQDDELLVEAGERVWEVFREFVATKFVDHPDRLDLPLLIPTALLTAVLKVISPHGEFPIQPNQFWQIIDRCDISRTASASNAQMVVAELEAIWATATGESFEDGFDSEFSVMLRRFATIHGPIAMSLISEFVAREKCDAEVAAQALRCMGELDDSETRELRRQLLENALENPSHIIRDGALIGLSWLNDPRSIKPLEEAAQHEKYDLLRTELQKLILRLKGRDR